MLQNLHNRLFLLRRTLWLPGIFGFRRIVILTLDNPALRKRKIASTLTFLGGCFAATDIKLCGSLPEAFLTRAEDLPKRNNPCLPCVSGSLPRDTVHNRRASDYSLLQFPRK